MRRRFHRCYIKVPTPRKCRLCVKVLVYHSPAARFGLSRVQMHFRRVIVLFLYSITLLLTTVKGYAETRQLSSDVWFPGTRNGKSIRNSRNDEELKHFNVQPRADSFFLGTRYGKRTWRPKDAVIIPESVPLCGEHENLTCKWVGQSNIYRCIAKRDL
ncbi:hypothetical protein JTB14_013397 [Gonioctena quinquepunctata]|nr:hypothetical protein JTB14_013397 [Gonioctena quinquepunctata]